MEKGDFRLFFRVWNKERERKRKERNEEKQMKNRFTILLSFKWHTFWSFEYRLEEEDLVYFFSLSSSLFWKVNSLSPFLFSHRKYLHILFLSFLPERYSLNFSCGQTWNLTHSKEDRKRGMRIHQFISLSLSYLSHTLRSLSHTFSHSLTHSHFHSLSPYLSIYLSIYVIPFNFFLFIKPPKEMWIE